MINPVKRLWQFITSPNYSRTVSILALLVVVLAIPLTVFIAQKQQEIRQRAAETCWGSLTYPGGATCTTTYGNHSLLAAWNLQEVNGPNSCNVYIRGGQGDDPTISNACTGNATITSYKGNPLTNNGQYQLWVSNNEPSPTRTCYNVQKGDVTIPCTPSTPTASTQILHPVGEITNVTPPTINAGQQVTVQGYVAAATMDAADSLNYTVTKVELWVTKRTPDQAPQNCPGPVSGIWCRIGFFEGESQHDATINGLWTPAEAGNYLVVINGFVKSGGKCSGNPVLPGGWEDCGRTGRRDMVELTVGQAPPPASPPTATPIILPPTTPTPILTPTPTPVTLCGHRCNSFTSGSKTMVADCDFANTYLDVSEANGVCMGSCAQVPVGYQRTPDKCGAVSTTTGLPRLPAPPSVGDPNPPAPTATPTPGGTLASLSISLPGIGNRELDVRTPRRASRAIRLSIFNQNNLSDVGGGSGSFIFDGRAFSGTVSLGSVPTGDYLIKAEMEMNTLKTLIPGTQHIVAGTTNQLTAVTLIPGDLIKDNVLDIRDYNMLISVFGSGRDTPADLNDDGVVNGVDYNIFLRSLKEKQRGD